MTEDSNKDTNKAAEFFVGIFGTILALVLGIGSLLLSYAVFAFVTNKLFGWHLSFWVWYLFF